MIERRITVPDTKKNPDFENVGVTLYIVQQLE
jgi:hypothetical protein